MVDSVRRQTASRGRTDILSLLSSKKTTCQRPKVLTASSIFTTKFVRLGPLFHPSDRGK